MPHFRLVTVDGEALGTIELGRPDWPDGSITYRGDKPNWSSPASADTSWLGLSSDLFVFGG
jgi:hypothetical protein